VGENIRAGDPARVWFLNKKQNQPQRVAAFSNIEEMDMNSTENTTMHTVPAESGFLERGKKSQKSRWHHIIHSLKNDI